MIRIDYVDRERRERRAMSVSFFLYFLVGGGDYHFKEIDQVENRMLGHEKKKKERERTSSLHLIHPLESQSHLHLDCFW